MTDADATVIAGLRNRKRRRTSELLLSTAVGQFMEKGVRGARLGEIAKKSEISQATLFNYFPNKASLAEAWVRGEIDDALAQVLEDLGDRGLRAAMRRLCRQLALANQDPKAQRVRLEAWREAGRAKGAASRDRNPLEQALAHEQESERVRGDLSAGILAEMLVDAIEAGVISGLRAQSTEAALAGSLQARVDLVLDGARKKNERVVAPSAAATSWTRRPVQST